MLRRPKLFISLPLKKSITRQYQCCGGKGPDDWITVRPVADGNKNFPFSCCIQKTDGSNTQCTDYFENGCLNIVQEIVSNHVSMLSLFALIVAVVQVYFFRT